MRALARIFCSLGQLYRSGLTVRTIITGRMHDILRSHNTWAQPSKSSVRHTPRPEAGKSQRRCEAPDNKKKSLTEGRRPDESSGRTTNLRASLLATLPQAIKSRRRLRSSRTIKNKDFS